MRYTIVPGLGGSGAEHWQTLWQTDLPDAVRTRPASWDAPEPRDWQNALDVAAAAHGGDPALLIAHSLGTLAAAEWALTHPQLVAGLMLVAVPDPAQSHFPDEATQFTRVTGPLGVPTLLVYSDDDPYCPAESARSFAAEWHADSVDIGACGHINTASGFGPWPEGRRLLVDFERSITSYC